MAASDHASARGRPSAHASHAASTSHANASATTAVPTYPRGLRAAGKMKNHTTGCVRALAAKAPHHGQPARRYTGSSTACVKTNAASHARA